MLQVLIVGYENLSGIEKRRVIFGKEGIGVCELTNSDSIYVLTLCKRK